MTTEMFRLSSSPSYAFLIHDMSPGLQKGVTRGAETGYLSI